MDCGPAALKCLLEGFGIPVSYGRLREACQTDVDGTSIDTIEVVANQLGVAAEQMMLPIDHLFLRSTDALPALIVVHHPAGGSHFVVIWRRLGGWLQLMAKTEADWPFIAREFENRYRGYRMRGEAPDYPPVLVGIANAHNGKEGMRKTAPVLIGDQRLAERVHALGTDGALIEMRQAGALAAPTAVLRIGSSGGEAHAA